MANFNIIRFGTFVKQEVKFLGVVLKQEVKFLGVVPRFAKKAENSKVFVAMHV